MYGIPPQIPVGRSLGEVTYGVYAGQVSAHPLQPGELYAAFEATISDVEVFTTLSKASRNGSLGPNPVHLSGGGSRSGVRELFLVAYPWL